MRRDLSKNTTAVGGTTVLEFTNTTAVGGSTVLEMDGGHSNPDVLASKATQSVKPKNSSSIGDILQSVMTSAMNIAAVAWLTNASRSTGGHVKFLSEFSDLPVLLGNDGNPVALFQFIEAIDGAVDYESVGEKLPTLSYAQMNGAISFLRKVAQFNTKRIDIDESEDLEAADDPDMIEAQETERPERPPIVFKRQVSSMRLEELKKQKFPLEGKQERIAKALAALHQESSIVLSTEVLRYIAEDPDLEDQF